MLEKKFINIGSCGFRKDGWINLDKSSSHYSAWQSPIDLEHDLMTFSSICLRDECLDIAYTSHTIEHLSDEYVSHLFKETHRILKNGGVFRITCPDIDKCYKAYKDGDKEYISSWKKAYVPFRKLGIGEQFLFLFASYLSPFHKSEVGKYTEEQIREIFDTKNKIDALTFFTTECQKYANNLQKIYPGDHISWWDYDKLKDTLEKVGFKNIVSQEFCRSESPELQGFDLHNEDNVEKLNHTLFLECTK
tara:strand:+ start:10862 stop:11605 length:744 start_codon:yes stop_codon:yes gene_type:complete